MTIETDPTAPDPICKIDPALLRIVEVMARADAERDFLIAQGRQPWGSVRRRVPPKADLKYCYR